MNKRNILNFASIGVLILIASGCALEGKKKRGEDAKVSSTEILIEPKYELNFQPSLDSPLHIQFVIKNATDPSPNYSFISVNNKGEDISQLFGTHQKEVSAKSDGKYDIKVSVPFILNEKTINGFKATVDLPGYKSNDNKPLRKETEFSLVPDAYPQDHFSAGSAIADFGVINEFLLSPDKAELPLADFIEAILNSPALGNAQETDRSRIRNRVEILYEGGKKIINMKGNLVISYSSPQEAVIRTNGFRLIRAGGDDSKVIVEVGVNDATRKAGSSALPELAFYTIKSPQIRNQIKSDEEGPFPASRGPRGIAADEGRCNKLVAKATQSIVGFPGARATCKDNLVGLNGENQTLTLGFKRNVHDVPVAPEKGQRLNSLVQLRDGAGKSVFKDRNGRECIFDENSPANETCVFANYTSALFPRSDINDNRELANSIEAKHAQKILPTAGDEGAGGYAGESSVVATKANRKDANEKLKGEIKATPNLEKMRDKLYGWEGHWQPGGAAYNAVANRCFEMLRNATVTQDHTIPGAVPDTKSRIAPESDVDSNRNVTFATQFPGLSVIDSLNVSTKVGDGAGGALEINPGETGEFLTIEGKKVFRFKESYRNKLRALANKIVVLGEPGKDGYDAPSMRAYLPASANEKEIQTQYETLAGPAGVPGFAWGFPNSEHSLWPAEI